jgi:hypothetical protein
MALWPVGWRNNLPWAGQAAANTRVTEIHGVILPQVDSFASTAATIAVAQERCIDKPDCSILAADEDLFIVEDGPIVVTEFVGIITTAIEDDVVTCQIQVDVDTPAGTVDLSTAVSIRDAAAGTSITFTAATPGVLTPTAAGAIDQLPKNYWLIPEGTIKAAFNNDRDGEIAWYMVYKPLSSLSNVSVA